ncbi:MAG: hypothetical protein LBR33_11435 [Propionibacteriaceae bacterium]|nr:hypothetical protein [Propionibacteriaceae bacterium]
MSWIVFEAVAPTKSARQNINSLNRLVVEFPLSVEDLDEYQTAVRRDDSSAKNALFCRLLLGCAKLIEDEHDAVATAMRTGLEAFQAGGYRNEWTAKKGRVKGWPGLTWEIRYRLTTDAFDADFILERDGQPVFTETALHTKPDEVHYKPQLRGGAKAGDSGVQLGQCYTFPFARIRRVLYESSKRSRADQTAPT